MGERVNFTDYCNGCKNCIHLTQIGKKTYKCNERNYTDGRDIVPIKDGKETIDFGACGGVDYITQRRAKRLNKIEARKVRKVKLVNIASSDK